MGLLFSKNETTKTSQNTQKEMKKKLMENPNIIKFIEMMNKSKTKFGTREKLPSTLEEFKSELSKLCKSMNKTEKFDKVFIIVQEIFTIEKNNMLKDGKANQENWYKEAITCDSHIWGNYTILKQYAHHLAQLVGKRLQDDQDFRLKQIQSNLAFLHMIRQVCDTIFINMNNIAIENTPNDQDTHEYLQELVQLCQDSIKLIISQKEVKDLKD